MGESCTPCAPPREWARVDPVAVCVGCNLYNGRHRRLPRVRNEKVRGSNPLSSTQRSRGWWPARASQVHPEPLLSRSKRAESAAVPR